MVKLYLIDCYLCQWVEQMAACGVDQYTFHVEATTNVPRTCRKIRDAGMKVIITMFNFHILCILCTRMFCVLCRFKKCILYFD